MPFCPHCKNLVPGNSAYCNHCGQAVSEGAATSDARPTPIATSETPSSIPPSLFYELQPSQASSTNGSKTRRVVASTLALVVVLVISAIVFQSHQKSRINKSTPLSQTSAASGETTNQGTTPAANGSTGSQSIETAEAKKNRCSSTLDNKSREIAGTLSELAWTPIDVNAMSLKASYDMQNQPVPPAISTLYIIIDKVGQYYPASTTGNPSLSRSLAAKTELNVMEHETPQQKSDRAVMLMKQFSDAYQPQIAEIVTACSDGTTTQSQPSTSATADSSERTTQVESAPVEGFLDDIAIDIVGKLHTISVNGWAENPQSRTPAETVDVIIDGQKFCEAKVGDSRSDVASARGPEFANSGWHCASSSEELSSGIHRVQAWASWHEGSKEVRGLLGNSKTFRSE